MSAATPTPSAALATGRARVEFASDAPRLLVVTPRRIGDVLLATPLIASLARAWPRARIDALVFRGTAGVLAGHPSLAGTLEIDERPTFRAHARLLATIARRYDLALSTIPGDRPTLYARAAGRVSCGVVLAGAKHRWKRHLLTRSVDYDDLGTHTVVQGLRLADVLGIERVYDVRAAQAPLPEPLATRLDTHRFAVIHAWPRFRYKMWTQRGFIELARWMHARGLRVVLSGAGDDAERSHVRAIAAQLPADTLDLCGALSLPQLATLLARACLYAGPDTVVTHMAAAAGIPTLALFGPSNPVKWGPWPAGLAQDASPWPRTGSGRCGNVWLLQGEASCAPGVPCLAEGCERRLDSDSLCLTALPAARAIAAAEELLGA